MLLDDATLQVPFLADLVTMADPTSRYSFLSYLKETGNLYPFYIRESFYPLRREYDDYCRWAADRLDSVRFGQAVTSVEHVTDARARRTSSRTATGEEFRGRRLVLGVGHVAVRARGCVVVSTARPTWSAFTRPTTCTHKERLQRLDSITIVGSGQSAAEIYHDLLAESPDHGYPLTWLTRSPRFFPMEYTKLTLEMTSPEYTAYFQGLPDLTRAPAAARAALALQGDQRRPGRRDLRPALPAAGHRRRPAHHAGHQHRGDRRDAATARRTTSTCTTRRPTSGSGCAPRGWCSRPATRAQVPAFLDADPRPDRVGRARPLRRVADVRRSTTAGDEIFVQNAEEHSHGFVAPDLGMGAYRNSVLVAAMLGREVYPVEKRIAVQSFGVPDHLKEVAR